MHTELARRELMRDLQIVLDKWSEGLPSLSMAMHVVVKRVAEDDLIETVLNCSLFSNQEHAIAVEETRIHAVAQWLRLNTNGIQFMILAEQKARELLALIERAV
jgi:hypothetical protein